MGGNIMKRNIINVDEVGHYVLLEGFNNLNEKSFFFISSVSRHKIIFTNKVPHCNDSYAIYAKKVNENYALVKNETLYRAIHEWKLEGTPFLWVSASSSYIPIHD